MQQHETLANRTISTCSIVSKRWSYFERITSISFSVYHVENLLLYSFTRRVSSTPIIACAHAIFTNEEVLRVVDVLVGSTLYAVDDLEPPI
jgi:hypothetical protein